MRAAQCLDAWPSTSIYLHAWLASLPASNSWPGLRIVQIDEYLRQQGRETQIVGAYRVTGASVGSGLAAGRHSTVAGLMGWIPFGAAPAAPAGKGNASHDLCPCAWRLGQPNPLPRPCCACCADEVAMRGAIEVAGSTCTLVSAFLSKASAHQSKCRYWGVGGVQERVRVIVEAARVWPLSRCDAEHLSLCRDMKLSLHCPQPSRPAGARHSGCAAALAGRRPVSLCTSGPGLYCCRIERFNRVGDRMGCAAPA